jgi:hypothetical protein
MTVTHWATNQEDPIIFGLGDLVLYVSIYVSLKLLYVDYFIMADNDMLRRKYWYWLRSLQLTLTVVCAGESWQPLFFVTSNRCIKVKSILD